MAGVKEFTDELRAAGVRWITPATVSGGGTDVAVEIAAAFAAGAQEGVVKGLPLTEAYPVATTIDVPTNKVLRVPGRTPFTPTADVDVDVFNVKQDATRDGPLIDVSGFSGYTKAAVKMDGTTDFGTPNVLTTVRNIRIKGKTGASGEGYGVLLDSGTTASHRISFAHFENIHIRGTGTAVCLWSHSTGGAGVTWVNSNTLKNVKVSQAKRCLDLIRDTDGAVTGNDLDITTSPG